MDNVTKPLTTPASIGLRCRKCGHRRFKVIYTRAAFGSQIIRRRECRRCGTRFTTAERLLGCWWVKTSFRG